MSAPPYMKLYVADYLGDTHHLGAAEHGAYLLLLMGMWRAGGLLPAADANLARLARCTPAQWAEIRDVILPFFRRSRGKLTHKRLDAEMAKYENTSGKRSTASNSRSSKKGRNSSVLTSANADDPNSNCTHNQNQNQRKSPQPPNGGDEQPQFELDAPPDLPDDAQLAFDAWNATAAACGLPRAKILDDSRRRAIRKRLETGGMPLWREAMNAVAASEFLQGRSPGADGRAFKADLTFVCQAKSFQRLIEGFYGPGRRGSAPRVDWV